VFALRKIIVVSSFATLICGVCEIRFKRENSEKRQSRKGEIPQAFISRLSSFAEFREIAFMVSVFGTVQRHFPQNA
jgi:hypothetical protein